MRTLSILRVIVVQYGYSYTLWREQRRSTGRPKEVVPWADGQSLPLNGRRQRVQIPPLTPHNYNNPGRTQGVSADC